QPTRQTKRLNFLCGAIARCDIAEIVELAPLGSPSELHRVFERCEMRLTEKAWKDCHREQQQKPRTVDYERGAQRNERQSVMPNRQKLRQQPDATGCLPTRPLELIVKRGVFKVSEIKRRCVLHQPNAGVVGKQVAKQALNQ